MRISWTAVMLLTTIWIRCGSGSPAHPSAPDLSGRWHGSSACPNAPFWLDLTHTGGSLRGHYVYGPDTGRAVTGTFAEPALSLVVDLGGTTLSLQGTLVNAGTVEGDMYTSGPGQRRYPFTMTRR